MSASTPRNSVVQECDVTKRTRSLVLGVGLLSAAGFAMQSGPTTLAAGSQDRPAAAAPAQDGRGGRQGRGAPGGRGEGGPGATDPANADADYSAKPHVAALTPQEEVKRFSLPEGFVI